MEIRKPAVAGRFYDADPDGLRDTVDSFLKDKAAASPAGEIKGLLVPHAGYAYSGPTAAAAYARLGGAHFDTVYILGTGHNVPIDGGATLPSGAFSTPLGELEIDAEAAAELLADKKLFCASARAHEREHAIEVQLPFLQRLPNPPSKIVPLLFNTDDLDQLLAAGRAIGKAAARRGALVCVSSDLSHYPPASVALISDRAALEAYAMAARNVDPSYFDTSLRLLESKAGAEMDTAACGRAAMIAGAAACLEMGANDFRLAEYVHSGMVSGDDSGVVGYGSGLFLRSVNPPAGMIALDEDARKGLLNLAREAIVARLRGVKAEVPALFPRHGYNLPSAVFVTLTIGGDLRGCIGTMEARGSLADSVAHYAVAAAFEDPRFEPLSAAEIDKVRIEISALSPLRKVASADAIEPGVHGVYIKRGRLSGTYLPQVWEHFKSKKDFLDSLCSEKAGLSPGSWKEKSTALYVYTVDSFEE